MAQILLMKCRSLGSALIAALGAGARLQGKDRRRRGVLLLAVTGAALVLVGGAALAATKTISADGIDRVKVAQEEGDSAPQSTSSTSFVDIPGASVSINADGQNLISARLSGESACGATVSGANGYCLARIVAVDGSGNVQQLGPGVGDLSAFDSTKTGADWENQGMDRAAKLPTGSYTIKAQWKVDSSSVKFSLDDYSLTVQRARNAAVA